MTAELVKMVGEMKSKVEEFKKDSVTKAEFNEKIDKFAKDLQEIDTLAKQSVKRMGTPGEYRSKAVSQIADRGVKSVSDLGNIKVHRTTALGQTGDIAVEDETLKVLELGETVAIADAVMQGHTELGEQYRRDRAKDEKGAFCSRFPRLGKQWGAFVDDIHKTSDGLDSLSGSTGRGPEWVPTQILGSTMVDQIRLACPTIDLFPTITMSGPVLTLPVKVNTGKTYVKAEAGNAVITNPTTSNLSFSAKLQAYYTTWTDEISEDSVVAVVPMLRADAVRAFAEGKDQAIVSGDADGTHMDTDYEAITAHASKLVNGLRRYCIRPTTTSVYDMGDAVLSSAGVIGAAQTMGRYAANALGDLVLLVSTKEWLRLLTDTSLLTVDKFGSRATILNGQLGSIAGIPILIDNEVQVRSDVTLTGTTTGSDAGTDTTGINSGTTANNDYRTAVLVNRNAWIHAERRAMTLETDKNIVSGINTMVMTHRWDFQPKWQPASYPSHTTTVGYKHTCTIIKIAD